MTDAPRRTKTRDNGEGTRPYQVADGRWRCDVTVGWERREDGTKRRLRKPVYGATEREAKAARNEMLRKRDAGDLPIGDSVTLEAWLTYWVENIAPRRCVIKTLEGYRGMIARWIVPEIGHVRLRDLAPEHVEQLHDAIARGRGWTRSNGRQVEARALSGTTALQAHRILSRALKVALQRGKVSRNVATLVDPPAATPNRERVKYLGVDDARKVLAAAAGRWDRASWSVGLAIGLRPGERLGLLWDLDVDLEAGTIEVQRQLQRRRRGADGTPGHLEIVEYAKSAAGYRVIALPAELIVELRAHRRRQLEARLALGKDWVGSPLGDLVFTAVNGSAIDPRRDWQAWQGLLAEAGAPYVSPHGMRHTAASLMLSQGIDVKVVQTILGHSSSQITRDLYQHVAPELAREAAASVGNALWG